MKYLEFNRSTEINGQFVTMSLCAEVIPASETEHRTPEVRIGLDDLEAGSDAQNEAAWKASEAWVTQNKPELVREALERYRMQEEVWA